MRQQLIDVISQLNLTSCSGIYLVYIGGQFQFNDFGMGIDLECIEHCTVNGAVDYLMNCFN